MICHALPTRPKYIPAPRRRPKGAKALGLTYEKRVGVYLSRLFPGLRSGVWFEFEGPERGCCQMDHFVVLDEQVLLVECKLKETFKAWPQIARYRRVLSAYFCLPVTGVQAVRYLSSGRKPLVDIHDALRRPGRDFLWHHLG